MAKTKKIVLQGCAGCLLGVDKEKNFVAPKEVEQPKYIIMAGTPQATEQIYKKMNDNIRLFTTSYSDQIVYLSSVQCASDKVNSKIINSCRQAYVEPILAKYPGVPILACGELVGHTLLKHKCAESTIAGLVRHINGHDTYFTKEDVFSFSNMEHFQIMLGSLLASFDPKPVEYEIGEPPKEFWNSSYVVLDIESENFNNFFLKKNDITLIGVANEYSDKVYCVVPSEQFLSDLRMYAGIVVAHNGNYDLLRLRAFNIKFNSVHDTLIREKCYPWSELGVNSLKWVLKRDYGVWGYESIVHTKWENGEIVTQEELAAYNAVDVIGTKHLYLDQLNDI